MRMPAYNTNAVLAPDGKGYIGITRRARPHLAPKQEQSQRLGGVSNLVQGASEGDGSAGARSGHCGAAR